jgi:hypothetical protein
VPPRFGNETEYALRFGGEYAQRNVRWELYCRLLFMSRFRLLRAYHSTRIQPEITYASRLLLPASACTTVYDRVFI